jgi:DNA-binding response OmpR family regulator
VLKIVLEKAGFLVEDYYNPILLLNEFKTNFYDLIILDIQMPDINGLQLCREIRKKDKKAKICFLTASENLYDSTYKFSSMYPIIKKPIENKELIITINDLLNNI